MNILSNLVASTLDTMALYLFPQAPLHQIESHSTSSNESESLTESETESSSQAESANYSTTMDSPPVTQQQRALAIFQGISKHYKTPHFNKAPQNRLVEMVNFLVQGRELCTNADLYERWACEIMPGCFKNLRRQERKKDFSEINWKLMSRTKTHLFLFPHKILATIVNGIDANQITIQSAKSVLTGAISGKLNTEDLEKLVIGPAITEKVEAQVALFLENIKFYALREKIENVFFRYFKDCRFKKEKHCKKSSKILNDIRKIVKENRIVELVQNKDLEKIYKASKNTHESSKYYRTTLVGIFKMLTVCLDLNDAILKKNISNMTFNRYSRGEINFICQPVMEALNYQTTGNEIMKAYRKLS